MYKFGTNLSFAAGILFILSGAAFFSTQVGKFDWNSVVSISHYIQSTPSVLAAWRFVNLSAALASFFAIAGVLSLSRLIKHIDRDWVAWAGALAILGYAIIAVTNIADLYQVQRLASAYPNLNSDAKATVEALGIGTLDPNLSLRFFALGIWMASVGWLSIRHSALPKLFAIFSGIAGVISISFVVLTLFEFPGFSLWAGALAVIFHPVWLIWTGIILRRA